MIGDSRLVGELHQDLANRHLERLLHRRDGLDPYEARCVPPRECGEPRLCPVDMGSKNLKNDVGGHDLATRLFKHKFRQLSVRTSAPHLVRVE